jgi:hypothetical protein
MKRRELLRHLTSHAACYFGKAADIPGGITLRRTGETLSRATTKLTIIWQGRSVGTSECRSRKLSGYSHWGAKND